MRLTAFLILLPFFGFAQPGHQITSENIYTEGMKFFILEDYHQALEQFESFVTAEPHSAAGYFMKSRAEIKLEKIIQAELSAGKSVELKKNQPYYLINYAEVLEAGHKNESAQSVYRDLIKLQPDKIDYYFKLAALESQSGDDSKALKTLSQAEKTFGESEEITKEKQNLLLKTNKVDAAIKEGKKQTGQNPKFVLNQADILIQNQRYNEASDILKSAIGENSEFEEAIQLLSSIYIKTTNPTDLKKLMDEIWPNSNITQTLKADLLEGYFNTFKHDKTDLEWIHEKLTESPDDIAKIQFIKAYTAKDLNLFKEAQDAFKKGLSLDKNQINGWIDYILLNYSLSDIKEMVKQADNASIYFPNHAETLFLLGLAQVLDEDPDEAEFSWEEASKLAQDPELKRGIEAGNFYLNKNEITADIDSEKNEYVLFFKTLQLLDEKQTESFSAAEKLSRISLNNFLYQIMKARAQLIQKNAEAAMEILNKLPVGISSAILYETKGDAYKLSEKTEEANAEYQTALKLNPDSKTIKNKLKQ